MDPDNIVAEQPTEVANSPTEPAPSAPADGQSRIVCDLAVVGRGTVALEAARAAIGRHARVVLIHQPDPEGVARIDPWLLSHRLDQAKYEPPRGNDRSVLAADAGPGSGAVGWLRQARQFFTPAAEDLAGEDIARAGVEVLQGPATFTGPDTLRTGAVEVQFRLARSSRRLPSRHRPNSSFPRGNRC